MVKSERELLFSWVSQTFSVLVPKKRGDGFLRVPFGHHYDKTLSELAYRIHTDICGLDGALEFECSRDIYGSEAARKEFVAQVIPVLEKHYGLPSREVSFTEFWEKHPTSRKD